MKRSRNSSQSSSHHSNIPIDFLLNMCSSEINVNGVKVTTHVLDSVAAVDKHIAELRSYLECKAKVVGLDIKTRVVKPGDGNYDPKNKPNTVVLCVFRRCLIILLEHIGDWGKTPQSLDDLFNDPKVCFVGAATIPAYHHVKFSVNADVGIKVSDWAARVLRKPELTECSLPDIAKEVGVSYRGEGATVDVVVASNTVLSDEEINEVVKDAYAYYQIGYKLLTSL